MSRPIISDKKNDWPPYDNSVIAVADKSTNQSLVPGLKTGYWAIFMRAYTLFFYKALTYYIGPESN